MCSTKNSAIHTAIEAKLKQIEKFESKYGESQRTIAWRKWCTDQEYRLRETQLRNNVADSINPNTNYLK